MSGGFRIVSDTVVYYAAVWQQTACIVLCHFTDSFHDQERKRQSFEVLRIRGPTYVIADEQMIVWSSK